MSDFIFGFMIGGMVATLSYTIGMLIAIKYLLKKMERGEKNV